MKLKEYFIREGITASQFAARIGRAVSTVTRLANSETVPEPDTIAKIVEATGGAVQPNDFFLNQMAAPPADNADVPEEDLLRAQCYRLLARLLASAPDGQTLAVVRALQGDGSPFGQALSAFAAVARQISAEAVGEEFQALFIGLAQGELTPYGSYYLTGFLHEKPLAVLRGDLAKLGLARAVDTAEPEDHIAALCEAMSCLITGSYGRPIGLTEQRRFFDAHLGSWAPRFFQDLEAAKSAAFYMPVGRLGRLFMDVEAQAFDMAA
jgi:TorA maturation chaperone TorD